MTQITSAADLATVLDQTNVPGLNGPQLASTLQSLGLVGADGTGSVSIVVSDAVGTTSSTGHQVVAPPAGTNVVVISGNAAVDPTTGKATPLYVAPESGGAVILGDGNQKVVLQTKPGDEPSTVQAGSGDSYIAASGNGANVLWGGTGNDTLSGNGHSNIAGGTGQDVIDAGNQKGASDTVYAGPGGDLVNLHYGDNLVYGNANATIYAGLGHDTIDAGHGPETIFGGGTTLINASNRNTIYASGSDTVVTGLGSDTINSTGGQTIQLGSGEGKLGDQTLNLSANGVDTLFGAGAPGVIANVKLNEAGASASDPTKPSYTSAQNTDGSTTITFADGNALKVQNVNIVFNDGQHHQF